MKISSLLTCCFAFLCLACQAQSSQNEIRFSKKHSIFFLDSLQAAEAITKDQEDHFFEQIQVLDMALQIGQTIHRDSTSRKAVLDDYKSFLQADVTPFTEDDQILLTKVFREAFDLCESLERGLFPDTVRLIKTKMAHYGPSVYYTREKCIIIPENVLEVPDYDGLLSVMLHEVFHIYSRYQPKQREALYQLIGFERYPDLQFSDSLQLRLLQNPDGVDIHWVVKLETGPNKSKWVTPLLTASQWQFSPDRTQFFDYLSFNLFEVDRQKEPAQVLSKSDGSSTLDFSLMPAYFRRIKDNTQYIIHPDEVLADNFVILALAEKEKERLKTFSQEGLKLLSDMRKILTGKK
ncbi:MAG: hypothetical protein AAGH79_02130 [Bacteroidota bacterium]